MSRPVIEPTQPPLHGYRGSLLRVNQPGRDLDRSHPPNAKVKNDRPIILLPLYNFMALKRKLSLFKIIYYYYYYYYYFAEATTTRPITDTEQEHKKHK
jgi:hypothetical protein